MSLHESTANFLEFYSDLEDARYMSNLEAYETRLRREALTDTAFISESLFELNSKTDAHKLALINLAAAKTDAEKIAVVNELQRFIAADLDMSVADLIKDKYFEILTMRREDEYFDSHE